jgi:hypothetical protein
MNKCEFEQSNHTKTRGLHEDEKSKTQDLRSTVQRLNVDICNHKDLKNQIKDSQKKIHEEKIRLSNLNDQ